MAKGANAAESLYSISQVHALTGVPKSTIRFWEKEFSEFLNPLRSVGNQRRYDKASVDTLSRINQLVNDEGYTLEGARRKLRPVETRQAPQVSENDSKLDDLANTMSDYLLQKLFERVRAEETRKSGLLSK
jgi:DNA-binding transcriptional MerR regulator